MKKQPTHFIEVFRSYNNETVRMEYIDISFLPLIENTNRIAGCKTIAIFKIYPKK